MRTIRNCSLIGPTEPDRPLTLIIEYPRRVSGEIIVLDLPEGRQLCASLCEMLSRNGTIYRSDGEIYRDDGVQYAYRMCDHPLRDAVQINEFAQAEIREANQRIIIIKKSKAYIIILKNKSYPSVKAYPDNNIILEIPIKPNEKTNLFHNEPSPFIYFAIGFILYTFNTATLEFLPSLQVVYDPIGNQIQSRIRIAGVCNGVITVRTVRNKKAASQQRGFHAFLSTDPSQKEETPVLSEKIDGHSSKQTSELQTSTVAFDELFDQCSCSICFETFDSIKCIPHVLDCGHTFCEVCLLNEKLCPSNQIKCPNCSKIHKLSNEKELPINYFAISIAEQTMKSRIDSRVVCTSCSQQCSSSSVRMCMKSDCTMFEKLICLTCVVDDNHGGHVVKYDVMLEKIRAAARADVAQICSNLEENKQRVLEKSQQLVTEALATLQALKANLQYAKIPDTVIAQVDNLTSEQDAREYKLIVSDLAETIINQCVDLSETFDLNTEYPRDLLEIVAAIPESGIAVRRAYGNSLFIEQKRKILKLSFSSGKIEVSEERRMMENERVDVDGTCVRYEDDQIYFYRMCDRTMVDAVRMTYNEDVSSLFTAITHLCMGKAHAIMAKSTEKQVASVAKYTNDLDVVEIPGCDQDVGEGPHARTFGINEHSPFLYFCNGRVIYTLNTDEMEFLPALEIVGIDKIRCIAAEGMLTTLIVCLCLTTTLHADDIDTRLVSATSTSTLTSTIGSSSLSSANTSSSSLIDVKEELLKIATTCLSPKDFELLTGNVLRHGVVRMFIHTLIEESVETIGLRELRTALKLPPPAPWQPRNRTEPTEHELASASTIEEYYKLREPRSKMGSLDSEYLFEHNVATAIAYLNKRLPSIQTVFRRTFEELCPSAPKVLNKKAIDSMIEAFHATLTSINNATSKMLRKYECQDVVN
ncbi:hypothetical protein PRIPAC_88037 [Pristionchus pacificus]|uniref:RING-type domain-containing protein n=1 Tax=Pristionchus pacificus TaxID=54126 RepID=A0A2A6CW72_PRIPA|nr:hypothetical protein PRIPAC_88037 [Pristionchus pacificus]|eukprot:PDM82484.1 hypothetical protein PRIPAC_36877 [Pristionchus pacificus]